MIEWLKLQNFQKHKKKFVRFSPRVTTFVGDTDAGKSTIIRALGLLLLNHSPRPRNRKKGRDPLISFGRKSARVSAGIDGHKVTRKKGKENVYILDGKKFKAVGNSTVPPEVATLFNVGEDNFQFQLDMPFWFTDTPGAVSRKLNQIVNLEIIDQTLKNVATELRDTKSELDVTMKRLKEATRERKKLDWVVRFYRDVKRLAKLKSNLDTVSHKASQIEGLVLDVSRLKRTHDLASKAILRGKSAIAAGRQIEQREQEIHDLEKLCGRIRKVRRRLKVKIPDIEDLKVIRKDADNFCEWLSEFESFIERLEEQKEKVCGSKAKLLKCQRRLKKKLKGFCPVCRQKMGKKSLPSHVGTCTSATKSPS